MKENQIEYVDALGFLTSAALQLQRKAIAQALINARKTIGVTRNQIALSTSLHYATVKSIEEGSDNYTIDNLTRYLVAINYNLVFSKIK